MKMTEKDKINAERNELNTLINKGINFDVERTIYKRQKGIFSFLKKRIPSRETMKFTIQEPTLSTLDRISVEQIELEINENIMTTEAGLCEAKKFAHMHSRRLARIIAMAVLGQDYVKAMQEGSRVRYSYDNDRMDQLTDLFLHNIKPSKLMQLTMLINTMSNLGDFTNSIRLMSAARTTMPIRIEEKGQD
jgi:hypothetical protein